MAEKKTSRDDALTKEIDELTSKLNELWSMKEHHEEKAEAHRLRADEVLGHWQQVEARRFVLRCALRKKSDG